MDLSTITSQARTIEILHPRTSKKLGVRVSLVSYDSPVLEKLRRRITDARLKLAGKGKNFDADELLQNQYDMAFTAIESWQWYEQAEEKDSNGKVITEAIEQAEYNGSIPELTRKNAFDIFKALPWFYDQISTEMGDTESFFQS